MDRPALSFKLRSARVPEMPKPYPLFEIFVYSPQMEGIHLRGGMVARGGIRWSDRKEDYRTEVLGLMKAQKVKNAIIVPDGSKGGFILKRVTATPDELRAEVSTQYVTLMRGLLDITDNRVDGEVVHPAGVRIHDAPDPYLVVAADKGTATFSDTANAISEEYGFWLGDAFASGGSHGYDHKELGITARGAWESVKRHFREVGIDVMAQPFTVVGIGDMSGDVFGNGMLYTPQIQLVCAFDHRHVFIDPTPDPAVSFAERQRLFAIPRSSWADYDASPFERGRGDHRPVDEERDVVATGAGGARRSPTTRPRRCPPNEVIRSGRCRPPSICSGTAASAPTSRPTARATPRWATARTTRFGSTATRCGRASWARAGTSASPSEAGSSTRSRAVASTPTSSTTRRASTPPTTR